MACTTTSYYSGVHYTEACSKGGNGICDGYCYDHSGRECSCDCHGGYAPDVQTVEEMAAWHEEEWRLYG